MNEPLTFKEYRKKHEYEKATELMCYEIYLLRMEVESLMNDKNKCNQKACEVMKDLRRLYDE